MGQRLPRGGAFFRCMQDFFRSFPGVYALPGSIPMLAKYPELLQHFLGAWRPVKVVTHIVSRTRRGYPH